MRTATQVPTAIPAAPHKPQEPRFRDVSRTNGSLPVLDAIKDDCLALVRSGGLFSWETEQAAIGTLMELDRLSRLQAATLWERFAGPLRNTTR